MGDSGYCTRDIRDFGMHSPPNAANGLFGLKFSELPTTEYNCFMDGFRDEHDFEEFKQDLRDFQKLKRGCCCRCADGDGGGGDDGIGGLVDLTELQFICKPNIVCKSRRGYASRGAKEHSRAPTVPPVLRQESSPEPVGLAVVDALSQEVSCQETAASSGSPGGTVDSGRSSGTCGSEVSAELELNISDILTEFLNEDEHFREFEQVFEAVRNRRISRDLDACYSNIDTSCRRSSHIETDTSCRVSSHIDTDVTMSFTKLDTGEDYVKNIQKSSLVNDIFADFFDNDETFLEFEKEFEKFRSSRRSQLLDSRIDISSNAYDLNDFCDTDVRLYSKFPISGNARYWHNEVNGSKPVLCSAKDWVKMVRRIRRSSCALVDGRTDRSSCHRLSVGEMSDNCTQPEKRRKAQSLADLGRCFKYRPPSRSDWSVASGDGSQLSQVTDGECKHQHSPLNYRKVRNLSQRQSSLPQAGDEPSTSDTNDNGSNSSSGHWAVVEDNHSCSSSCFCQSDLFIEEAGDRPETNSPQARPSRGGCSPSVEVEKHQPANADCGLNENSLRRFNFVTGCDSTGISLPSSPTQVLPPHNSVSNYDDTDLEDCESISPKSASFSQLSDADSEHYHTATSDLSGVYSTAKSHLSQLIEKLQCAIIDANLDLAETTAPSSDSGFTECIFQPIETPKHRSILTDRYHSYHGRDNRAKCKDKRPRSESACQYTCHEHCVPSVTLSCKSVCADGCDVIAARTPSPPDTRSHGEACVFMGNIQARPGAARIVPSGTADSPTTAATRASLSISNFQHLAQGKHTDTPRPSIHHRSWSISEDIVTPHSHPIQHSGVASDHSRHSPQTHQGFPPPCLPSCSDCHFDSFPHGNSPRHQELPSASQRAGSGCIGEGVFLSQQARTGEKPAGDTSALDLPVYRHDEESSHEATTEKDETDSGYRSGTIPDDKLPRVPSQATLDQQELKRKVAKYNHFVPAACLEVTGKESFQGFMKVTMNLIRPITMELGARPPSIYELLTKEHIVEENTQQVAFYMPRDTHKSLHITSDTTTKEVVASLLKKFHILDHPRKFAMYEQEFSDRNKLVRLRRLTDKDCPLRAVLNWDPERMKNYRIVLQENETGEIVWDAFSLPELNNFLRVLDREEKETVIDLKHKYAYMKQYMERRLAELRGECTKKITNKT